MRREQFTPTRAGDDQRFALGLLMLPVAAVACAVAWWRERRGMPKGYRVERFKGGRAMKAILIVLVLAGTAMGQANPAYERFQQEQKIREANAEYEHDFRRAPRRIATTAPATTQASPQARADDARAAMASAAAEVERAKAAAMTSVQSTAEYQAAKAQQDASMAALESARRTGTPQERLDASGKFVAAKRATDSIVAAALAADPAVAAANAALARARESLTVAQAATQTRVTPDPSASNRAVTVDAKVGDLGVPSGSFTVVSIVDRANMIVDFAFPGHDRAVWMRGWDTSDMTDRVRFRLDYAVRATGTTQYQNSAGGVATVLILEPAK
jgi:hypothetical protein